MRAQERAMARKQLDKRLNLLQNVDILARPPRGWVKAIREALGNGMLRATTVDGWKAKAWALRDSFDGLLMIAIQRLGRK